MPEASYTTKVVFPGLVVKQIRVLYIRKRFLWKFAQSTSVLLLVAYGCVHELSHIRFGPTRWWSLGYAIAIISVIFILCLNFESLRSHLKNAFPITGGGIIEYHFTDDELISSFDGKRKQLFWQEVKKVWVSADVLVLVSYDQTSVPVPLALLNRPERQLVIEKLAGLNLLTRQTIHTLRSLP